MSHKDKKHKGFATHIFNGTTFGKVKISFNEEDEVKTVLLATGEHLGHEDEVAEALWKAYAAEKVREWRLSFDIHTITRASGKVLQTPLHAETKAWRQRHFYTVADGHDKLVEIRVEDLKTMIKIASPRAAESSVLRRAEISIEQQFPGQIGFSCIPGEYGKMLSRKFNGNRSRIDAVRTQSWRDKITVPIQYDWRGERYVVLYERAKDIGVSQSRAGHIRDITEFEGEVKEIIRLPDYLSGEKVDIKKTPSYAGLTHEDIKGMTDGFLHERLENFIRFADKWLAQNGYAGCCVRPVTESKSWPEMAGFHEVLASLTKKERKAALQRIADSDGFCVDRSLNAARLSPVG